MKKIIILVAMTSVVLLSCNNKPEAPAEEKAAAPKDTVLNLKPSKDISAYFVPEASSVLPPQGNNVYKATNICDGSSNTAWVEGVPGYGVGESVTFYLPAMSQLITSVAIKNGYVKTHKSWTENSRVKTLKMYVNDKLYAVLNLADTSTEQIFYVGEVGYKDRKDLASKPDIVVKFEIADTYAGDKFQDTAISSIRFNVIDESF